MKLRMQSAGLFAAAVLCAAATAHGGGTEIAAGVAVQQDLFNAAMREGVACYRIPALATAVNGDLLAAIDERVASCKDLGENPNINIVLRRSSDLGLTWSPIQTIVDFPEGLSASDPSLIVDRQTGAIFLFYNYMDHFAARGEYRLHVLRSNDHGLTWQAPEDITDQITPDAWRKDFKFITSGEGSQAQSGMLLHTLVNLKHGLHAFGSKDHGQTWFLVNTPLVPGDESRIIELTDGTWMVNSRVKKAGMRYVHRSSDQGKSWSTAPDPQLADPGCNASLIRYTGMEDGHTRSRLLFSNADSADKRRNLSVRISYDEGMTWSKGKTIHGGSAAYSSLAVLPNGDIGLLFEADDYTANFFVRFTLDWLTDGQDHADNPAWPGAASAPTE
ncbi:MAG: exo-alpha-sialidase [Candidatus Hydrogenedentes bacterium]|nr:exo-alpha-sialidase [Candidatus Hydrogenedentota bacterium]